MAEQLAFNRDCMEAMKEFPDGFFDLAVVDPPYGIGADNFKNGAGASKDGGKLYSTAVKMKNRLNQGGGKLKNRALNTSDTSWDVAPSPEYFDELRRVSKNQIIWGGNYFNLPPSRGIIVWDKLQPWDNFSQVEIAWTSFDRPARLFRFSTTGGAKNERKIHPTQKPVSLYAWIFGLYAKPGMKIIDTHLGSGSSRIAAYNAGLDFWGYEIDKVYFDMQEARFEQHTAQENLFLQNVIE
jgi:site-specific DNA-methyltransferase (adenine-specific)